MKRALLKALPSTPTSALENILIDSLTDDGSPRMRRDISGRIGSSVACRPLRDTAGAARTHGDHQGRWNQADAIKALGQLRDPASLSVLMGIVRSGEIEIDNRHAAITSLRRDSDRGGRTALVQLLDLPELVQWVAARLAFLGMGSAANRAILSACEADSRGAVWLAEGVRRILFGHGFKRGEYFRHVDQRLFAFSKKSTNSISRREEAATRPRPRAI